jgi:hypothetical protein
MEGKFAQTSVKNVFIEDCGWFVSCVLHCWRVSSSILLDATRELHATMHQLNTKCSQNAHDMLIQRVHPIKLSVYLQRHSFHLNFFLCLFQIIDDHYHFEHKKLVKRSIEPSHHHQNRLNEDDRVAWHQQQRVKSRQKRDFTRLKPVKTSSSLLNDPKWSSMWYLVSWQHQKHLHSLH